MPDLLRAIAHAFDDEPQRPTTFKDVSMLDRRLFFASSSSTGGTGAVAASGGQHSSIRLAPSCFFVHGKRTEVPLPLFPTIPRSDVPTVDAAIARRSEQLHQEMTRDFSDFSLAGLAVAEQQVHALRQAPSAGARAGSDRVDVLRRALRGPLLDSSFALDTSLAGSGRGAGRVGSCG